MHKCFISYKKEDINYRNFLLNRFGQNNFINKSLDRTIDSVDGDYVMEVIRRDYLCDSTVTLFLIGKNSSENEGRDYLGYKNYFIQRELAASLFNGKGNTRNGIVGIVLPDMYDQVFKGQYSCSICGRNHNYVNINDSTVIREFSENYYVEPHSDCAWQEDDRYCVLAKWDDFIKDPDVYIEQAFEKRFSPVAQRIRIRNLR